VDISSVVSINLVQSFLLSQQTLFTHHFHLVVASLKVLSYFHQWKPINRKMVLDIWAGGADAAEKKFKTLHDLNHNNPTTANLFKLAQNACDLEAERMNQIL
jgi:hypothetical protein